MPPPPHPACRPGILLAIPLAIGFGVSRAVAQPLWSYAEQLDPAAFAATDNQKVEGAHELHIEELRLRMVGVTCWWLATSLSGICSRPGCAGWARRRGRVGRLQIRKRGLGNPCCKG